MIPHISCAMANARLMVVMPSPVELLSGEMNSPSDCLAPIVTIRIAAAASVITHALRALPVGMSPNRAPFTTTILAASTIAAFEALRRQITLHGSTSLGRSVEKEGNVRYLGVL